MEPTQERQIDKTQSPKKQDIGCKPNDKWNKIELSCAKNHLEFTFSEHYLYRYSNFNGRKIHWLGTRHEAISLNFQLRQAIQKQGRDGCHPKKGLVFFQRFKRSVAQKLLIIPDEILFELPFDLLKALKWKIIDWECYGVVSPQRSRIQKQMSKPDVDIISPRYTVLNEIPWRRGKEVEPFINFSTARSPEVITDKKIKHWSTEGRDEYFILRACDQSAAQSHLMLSDSLKMYDTGDSQFPRLDKKLVLYKCVQYGSWWSRKGKVSGVSVKFLEAGVQTVVQSLWEVNDEARISNHGRILSIDG